MPAKSPPLQTERPRIMIVPADQVPIIRHDRMIEERPVTGREFQ